MVINCVCHVEKKVFNDKEKPVLNVLCLSDPDVVYSELMYDSELQSCASISSSPIQHNKLTVIHDANAVLTTLNETPVKRRE